MVPKARRRRPEPPRGKNSIELDETPLSSGQFVHAACPPPDHPRDGRGLTHVVELSLSARMKMRALGNALVWMTLTIGVPGMLFEMTAGQNNEDINAKPHQSATCSVCRHYRGTTVQPPTIEDENMILVSP